MQIRTIPTTDAGDDWLPDDGIPCAASCVVPRFLPFLKKRNVFIVTAENCGLDLSLMDRSTLGTDRIANAYALTITGSLPAMTIDCGTAINAEIVDERKRFLGGAIFPGRTLIRKTLHVNTALLPHIEMEPDLPPFPGTNTRDAMRFGMDSLLFAGVRHLVERARSLFSGKELRILVCGGDRRFFLSHIDGLVDGGDDLTLCGIEAIYRKEIL